MEEKVPTPGWLNYERYGTFANIYAGAPAEKAYAWTIAQVKSILKEETYICLLYTSMNTVQISSTDCTRESENTDVYKRQGNGRTAGS